MRVELRAVVKRFAFPGCSGEAVAALDGVDLVLEPGQRLAVHGPSGSGKSTLASIVAGLARPDSGSALWDGRPLDAWGPGLHTRVGVAFQESPLVPELTARENLLLPQIVAGSSEPARVDELLDAIGLADRFDVLPQGLSGGERRRLCVARALVLRPSLLVLDEPTSDLDPEGARALLDLVLDQARGATLLLVSHDPEAWGRLEHSRCLRGGRWLTDRSGG